MSSAKDPLMESPANPQVTQLLQAWGTGDRRALHKLMPLLQRELHGMAARYMGREKAGHTLQATALINEAYLRLVDIKSANWQNRAHFFAVCARVMRRILVDHARSHNSPKRGAAAPHLSLNEAVIASSDSRIDFMALDEAMAALAKVDARKSEVVELRFFGGLTVAETAEVMHISEETVLRDWNFAKGWLMRELGS
jgi:RNA polymerase sigma-70 factor, ECF subfamily